MVSKWFYVALVLAIFLNYSQAQSSPNKDVKTVNSSDIQVIITTVTNSAVFISEGNVSCPIYIEG